MKPAITSALDAAVAYLAECQGTDGHWQDYHLPVGSSDAWVTGYVGLALAECGGDGPAHACAERAADWLERHRPYPAGWGYNGQTGPDADSTAFALGLLARLSRVARRGDGDWLRQCWREEGGFATYPRGDAWGEGHGDVTPAAYLALAPGDQADLRGPVLDYLQRIRHRDGSWPSYWWRTSHYATYWSLVLLRRLGWTPEGAPPVVRNDEIHGIHTPFDLALVTGIAFLQQAPAPLVEQLAGKLLSLQRSDGAWPGGANLRVTDPTCRHPWEAAQGRLYSDIRHLITTATALRVLTVIGRSLQPNA